MNYGDILLKDMIEWAFFLTKLGLSCDIVLVLKLFNGCHAISLFLQDTSIDFSWLKFALHHLYGHHDIPDNSVKFIFCKCACFVLLSLACYVNFIFSLAPGHRRTIVFLFPFFVYYGGWLQHCLTLIYRNNRIYMHMIIDAR